MWTVVGDTLGIWILITLKIYSLEAAASFSGYNAARVQQVKGEGVERTNLLTCPLLNLLHLFIISSRLLCLWRMACRCRCITLPQRFDVWCNFGDSLSNCLQWPGALWMQHDFFYSFFVQYRAYQTALRGPQTNTCDGNNLDNPHVVFRQERFYPVEQLLLSVSLESWAHWIGPLCYYFFFFGLVYFAGARCFNERSKFDLGPLHMQQPSSLHLALAAFIGLIETCRFMLPSNKEFAADSLSCQGRQLNAHKAQQPLPTTQT